MSTDKLPALPPRPKSFRAKTFDPYDDVFGYAETKARMDAQDARIATLIAEAEISDERVAEYRDANRALGKRMAELTDRGTDLDNKYDEAKERIAELEFKFHATELGFEVEQKLRKRGEARVAELEKDRDAWKELCNLESKEVECLEREIREAAQLLTRSKDSTSSQILYRDIVQWERNAERKNDDV